MQNNNDERACAICQSVNVAAVTWDKRWRCARPIGTSVKACSWVATSCFDTGRQ